MRSVLRKLGCGWRRRIWGEGNGRRIGGVVAGVTVRASHILERP